MIKNNNPVCKMPLSQPPSPNQFPHSEYSINTEYRINYLHQGKKASF